MAALIVFTREKMRNPQEFKLYQEGPRPDPTAHPLEALALYGKIETLEGPSTEGAIILKFPTIAPRKIGTRARSIKTSRATVSSVPTIECLSSKGLEAVFGKPLTGSASGSLSTNRYPARSA